MNRHESREQVIFALYQHLLLNKDLTECFEDNFGEEIDNEYVIKIMYDLLNNKDKYIKDISSYLVNWTFDRLNLVDQAILINACSELNIGEASKAIIIDEAVMISKKYSDEEAYKYINGVLDKYG